MKHSCLPLKTTHDSCKNHNKKARQLLAVGGLSGTVNRMTIVNNSDDYISSMLMGLSILEAAMSSDNGTQLSLIVSSMPSKEATIALVSAGLALANLQTVGDNSFDSSVDVIKHVRETVLKSAGN